MAKHNYAVDVEDTNDVSIHFRCKNDVCISHVSVMRWAWAEMVAGKGLEVPNTAFQTCPESSSREYDNVLSKDLKSRY